MADRQSADIKVLNIDRGAVGHRAIGRDVERHCSYAFRIGVHRRILDFLEAIEDRREGDGPIAAGIPGIAFQLQLPAHFACREVGGVDVEVDVAGFRLADDRSIRLSKVDRDVERRDGRLAALYGTLSGIRICKQIHHNRPIFSCGRIVQVTDGQAGHIEVCDIDQRFVGHRAIICDGEDNGACAIGKRIHGRILDFLGAVEHCRECHCAVAICIPSIFGQGQLTANLTCREVGRVDVEIDVSSFRFGEHRAFNGRLSNRDVELGLFDGQACDRSICSGIGEDVLDNRSIGTCRSIVEMPNRQCANIEVLYVHRGGVRYRTVIRDGEGNVPDTIGIRHDSGILHLALTIQNSSERDIAIPGRIPLI